MCFRVTQKMGKKNYIFSPSIAHSFFTLSGDTETYQGQSNSVYGSQLLQQLDSIDGCQVDTGGTAKSSNQSRFCAAQVCEREG